MAIQPIEMQSMISQLDKLSKSQVHAQQGMQVLNAVEQEIAKNKELDKKKTVEETKNLPDDMTTVKDKLSGNESNKKKSSNSKKNKKDNTEEENECTYFSDPKLGQHIDISG